MSNIKVGEIVDHVALEAERELMSKLFGSHETEDQLVERLAKASAVAAGHANPEVPVEGRPVWEYHTVLAKQFLAMFKALQDG